MKRIQAKKHKIGTCEIEKYHYRVLTRKDTCQMMEFIPWLIFIKIVIIEKYCDN